VFERFTHDSRQIVTRAQQEAADLQHPFVGTEHLLLAMLTDPGTAGEVLRAAGLEHDGVRAELARLLGTPPPLVSAEDAEALRSVGIDVDAVLARIRESFGPGALVPPAPARRGWFGRRGSLAGGGASHAPGKYFAARSKKVLELSLREALRRGDREIRTGHLLLGLLREGEGLAARILTDAGLDLDEMRRRVEREMPRAA
jgi:ATP-dependent Clp protease ATP-binding subunit ClpA